MIVRLRADVPMNQTRVFSSALKLDQAESGIRIVLARNANWNTANQRLQVRFDLTLKDGSTQQYTSGIRTGEVTLNHDGSQRTESEFSVKFVKASESGPVPDNIIDTVTVTLMRVQGSPTVNARLETF